MNLTRRRALQGIGAIGFAGLAGNAVVAADSTVNNVLQQGESAALRVAHVSPDAPNVDVRVQAADGAGAGGAGMDAGGNEMGVGDGEDLAQEDRTPEFEFVTVEDSRDDGRADGGTGGLF